MATQIRSKQPRPLSIITEISLDDYIDSLQTESAKNAKDSSDSETPFQPRPARRISVAPLEHPIVALDQDNPHAEDFSLRDISGNSGSKCTSKKSVPCENNDRTTDVLEQCSHPSDTVVDVQNVDSIQSRLSSANDARCKHVEGICNGLLTAHLSDHGRVEKDVNINTDHGNTRSKLTDKQTNSDLSSSMSKNVLDDSSKSEEKSKPLSGSEKWASERRKLCSALNLNVSTNWAGKYSDVNNMTKTVKNPTIPNVERQKVDEKETLSDEQQAWRNKVRKSSSFTSLSVKARPLRRSMGSFDYKNASFLARPEIRSLEKGDSTGSKDSSHSRARFYISSDVYDGQKEFNLGHESAYNNVEQGHPRDLSFCGSRSWNGLSSIPRDGSTELSSSACLNSLPNLGQILTSQQSEISNSQSGESSPETLPYKNKTRKHSYTDSLSNNILVRRISAVDQSDLRSLQALATRLNLPTRRLSTTIWKEKYMGSINNNIHLPKDTCIQSESGENDKDTNLHCDRHNDDSNTKLYDRLALVRDDLIKMRLQDQALSAQFMKIRHQMVELRLAVECQNYMELLDGAQEDIEEERELSRMVDIPSELLSPHHSLLHVGLTKMNFSSRRFSTC